MGLFKKAVQRLSIEFYSKFEAGLKFENLIDKTPDDSLINYYFLTYYAKILYNLGKGEDSYYLVRIILQGLENALKKNALIKHERIVEYKGKGNKTYLAEWDKKGTITTKMTWGKEGEYAPSSVILFLDYLNQTLREISRQKLFCCISEFHKLLLDQESTERLGWEKTPISKISYITDWSSKIVTNVETNWNESHENKSKD